MAKSKRSQNERVTGQIQLPINNSANAFDVMNARGRQDCDAPQESDAGSLIAGLFICSSRQFEVVVVIDDLA